MPSVAKGLRKMRYKNVNKYLCRAIKINHYLKEWKSVGFRSPSMHNKLEWIHDLNIEYDSIGMRCLRTWLISGQRMW